ncbi:MAG: hypothetical protein OEY38_01120 [Gammaproteobacteria bacterium]|nr:hypothetical protein [Gammaproteobacteria bacterium]
MSKLGLLFFFLFFSSFSLLADQLSGPRMGITRVDAYSQQQLQKIDIHLNPYITQFGWQFERRFFTTQAGPAGVTAVIPLLGGFEQGVVVPSVSWVTGLRLRNGFEFAVGPSISLASTGIVFSVGHTSRLGDMNIPINLAYVVTRHGGRLSLLFGFNGRDPSP